VGGRLDRGVAVHHKLAVVTRIIVELAADPDQVFLVLLGERNAGPDPGMNEELLLGLPGERQALHEAPVRLGDRLERARVKRVQPLALADLDPTDPYDYAKAIELCDTDSTCGLDTSCPGELKCVDGKCRRVLLAEFNPEGSADARTIDKEFAVGGPFNPRANETFAILSSGLAKYDPQETCPQSGTDFFIVGGVDPDASAADPVANDMAQLTLEILVPTNARSFSFDFHFFTTEYPDYLGTEYNDTFWVQLNSKKYTGNISFDKNGTPIRLNNAFFDICDPDPANPQTQQFCTQPAALLSGTGYAKDCPQWEMECSGQSCGGSTGWLTTTSPVEPGEKITLTFSIFDKGDGILDSTVLIDNFRWRLAPASKPVTGPD